MKSKLFLLSFCLAACSLFAQDSTARNIRVVDSLTKQEKEARNTVLLRSELDSLIAAHSQVTQKSQPAEQVVNAGNDLTLYLAAGAVLLFIIACLLYLLFNNQKKFNRVVRMLHKQVQHLEQAAYSSGSIADTGTRAKGRGGLERKIESLSQALETITAEKEKLEQELADVNKVRHDFESVKQQMMEVYKIRNYPGFNKEKTETEIVKSMLDTERSVAMYAYEHFLKPVMSIADENKNNPARIRPAEREKLIDLLISLALMYSEYLYLRISELSVGGKIVERIDSLKNGSTVDPGTLKTLSTEHGSRALVIRMALDKTAIQNLSYPVFDETNLNLS